MHRVQSGFTIFEIVIVFILLAGIMAVVMPRVIDQFTRAKGQEAKMNLMHVAGQIEVYRAEVGKYPDSLRDLVRKPAAADNWNGPYVKEIELKDAFGNEYKYSVPGQGRKFDLISLGADGKEGGEGENRDVSN